MKNNKKRAESVANVTAYVCKVALMKHVCRKTYSALKDLTKLNLRHKNSKYVLSG